MSAKAFAIEPSVLMFPTPSRNFLVEIFDNLVGGFQT